MAIAVQNGAINAAQADVAYADFLAQFHDFKWIDDVATAFGEFATSAITDFGSIGDAAGNFLRRLADIVCNSSSSSRW